MLAGACALWANISGGMFFYPQRELFLPLRETTVAGKSFTTKPSLTSEFFKVFLIASLGDLINSLLEIPLHSDFLVTSSISHNFS